jgi:hypothetical protein
MSKASEGIAKAVQHSLDALAMISFNDGFEAAIESVEELSNQEHNSGNKATAEILRWLAKELRGENA